MGKEVIDMKGNIVKADRFEGEFAGDIDVAISVDPLTDNTGVASPNDTIENVPAATAAVTDTTAASLTSTNAALTAVENNIADLATKVNELIEALGG